MELIPEFIEDYASAFSDAEPEVLKKLNRDTRAKVLQSRMLSGHLQGRLLSFISRMIKPTRILEIGTYTGYSALCLAEGLTKTGKLHTIDHNPELEDFAAVYFEMAGMDSRIVQHVGEAIDVIPSLKESFDLVFLDADKKNYVRYFELILPKLPKGGVVLADNVLWSGKVVEPPDEKDEEAMGIVRFNQHVRDHKGVRQLLLPLRDGLMVIEKI
ncbi:MAG: O-methyltransferase [Bacteroidales bacterium]